MKNKKFDLFISFAGSDRKKTIGGKEIDVIFELKKALESHLHTSEKQGWFRHRFRVCTYDEDFDLEETVADAICAKISDAKNLLVVCSKRAAESEHVDFELEHYLNNREESPLAAFLDRMPEDAFPQYFKPGTLAANLQISPDISIKQWRQQIASESHKVVAKAWGLPLKDVEDRFQRDQKKRITQVAIIAILMLGLSAWGGASWKQVKDIELKQHQMAKAADLLTQINLAESNNGGFSAVSQLTAQLPGVRVSYIRQALQHPSQERYDFKASSLLAAMGTHPEVMNAVRTEVLPSSFSEQQGNEFTASGILLARLVGAVDPSLLTTLAYPLEDDYEIEGYTGEQAVFDLVKHIQSLPKAAAQNLSSYVLLQMRNPSSSMKPIEWTGLLGVIPHLNLSDVRSATEEVFDALDDGRDDDHFDPLLKAWNSTKGDIVNKDAQIVLDLIVRAIRSSHAADTDDVAKLALPIIGRIHPAEIVVTQLQMGMDDAVIKKDAWSETHMVEFAQLIMQINKGRSDYAQHRISDLILDKMNNEASSALVSILTTISPLPSADVFETAADRLLVDIIDNLNDRNSIGTSKLNILLPYLSEEKKYTIASTLINKIVDFKLPLTDQTKPTLSEDTFTSSLRQVMTFSESIDYKLEPKHSRILSERIAYYLSVELKKRNIDKWDVKNLIKLLAWIGESDRNRALGSVKILVEAKIRSETSAYDISDLFDIYTEIDNLGGNVDWDRTISSIWSRDNILESKRAEERLINLLLKYEPYLSKSARLKMFNWVVDQMELARFGKSELAKSWLKLLENRKGEFNPSDALLLANRVKRKLESVEGDDLYLWSHIFLYLPGDMDKSMAQIVYQAVVKRSGSADMLRRLKGRIPVGALDKQIRSSLKDLDPDKGTSVSLLKEFVPVLGAEASKETYSALLSIVSESDMSKYQVYDNVFEILRNWPGKLAKSDRLLVQARLKDALLLFPSAAKSIATSILHFSDNPSQDVKVYLTEMMERLAAQPEEGWDEFMKVANAWQHYIEKEQAITIVDNVAKTAQEGKIAFYEIDDLISGSLSFISSYGKDYSSEVNLIMGLHESDEFGELRIRMKKIFEGIDESQRNSVVSAIFDVLSSNTFSSTAGWIAFCHEQLEGFDSGFSERAVLILKDYLVQTGAVDGESFFPALEAAGQSLPNQRTLEISRDLLKNLPVDNFVTATDFVEAANRLGGQGGMSQLYETTKAILKQKTISDFDLERWQYLSGRFSKEEATELVEIVRDSYIDLLKIIDESDKAAPNEQFEYDGIFNYISLGGFVGAIPGDISEQLLADILKLPLLSVNEWSIVFERLEKQCGCDSNGDLSRIVEWLEQEGVDVRSPYNKIGEV